MKKIRATVLINTLNESANLKGKVRALCEAFDEILVVDMESDDDTTQIAAKEGAKVISTKRLGYVEPARIVGIEAAAHDVIFILDADETPSKELIEHLCVLDSENFEFLDNKVLAIPRLNVMMGKEILHGSFKPDSDAQLRVFKRKNVTLSNTIHRGITTSSNSSIEKLRYKDRHFLLHQHSQTAYQFLSRLVRYCAFEVSDRDVGANSFSIYRTIRRFMVEYFYKLSFLNGRAGFAIAYIVSIRAFLKCK